MSIAEKARNKTLKREDLENLANGDDINKLEDGYTPLGFAVMNGDAFTTRLLLEHKASLTRRSETGLSPLHLAVTAKNNAAGVVQILLGAPGIEVDAEDDAYPHDTP
ncbi:Ankyrin repeat protein [Apiospora sp. TS-2023a]